MIDKLIFGSLYNILYFSFALSVFLYALQIDYRKYNKIAYVISKIITIVFLIAFVLLIGFRSYNIGTDTNSYYLFNWQMNVKSEGLEFLFDWVIQIIKLVGGSFTWFLLLISFLFFLFNYKTYYNISKINYTPIVFILFTLLSLFFAKSLAINIIRQGLALGVLFYVYSIWKNSKPIKVVFFLVLSFIIHTTVIIPILLFIVVQYLPKKISIKYYYLIFVLGIIISAAGLGILNIAPFLKDLIGDNRRLGYLRDSDEIYQVGFKVQFVAFNSFFLLLSHFIENRLKKSKNKNLADYQTLLKYYILASFVLFMVFQIPYSDRWGLFSWFVIPILVAPAFSVNLKFNKSILVLLFTFIYIFFEFYGNTK